MPAVRPQIQPHHIDFASFLIRYVDIGPWYRAYLLLATCQTGTECRYVLCAGRGCSTISCYLNMCRSSYLYYIHHPATLSETAQHSFHDRAHRLLLPFPPLPPFPPLMDFPFSSPAPDTTTLTLLTGMTPITSASLHPLISSASRGQILSVSF